MKKETQYLFNTLSVNLAVAFLIIFIVCRFRIEEVSHLLSVVGKGVIISILALCLITYLVGEKFILKFKGQYKIRHGVMAVLILVLGGIIAGCSVGFLGNFNEIKVSDDLWSELNAYYIKPAMAILPVALIPVLISGSVLGYYLKKNCNQI